MDVIYFLGRFHVLALHLPIGILTLAIGLELAARFKRVRGLEPLIEPVWLAGWLTGLLTVILGFMHATESGFQDSSAVELHRLSGVSLTTAAFLVWLWRLRLRPEPAWGAVYAAVQPAFSEGAPLARSYRRYWAAGSAAVALLLFTTGHLGGNLTHGETYLWQYAPTPIRRLAGISAESDPRPAPKDLASADLYLDIVAPAIHQRCDACHNAGKKSGGLSVADHAAILKGGRTPVIVPGDPAKSDLFRRIGLSPSDKDYMPKDGKTAMTADQIAAVGVWIAAGAPKTGVVGRLKLTAAQTAILQRALGATGKTDDTADDNAGLPQPSGPALPVVPPADARAVKALEDSGFAVRTLSKTSQLLAVDFTARRGLTEADFAALARVAPQVRVLNLSDAQVTDGELKALAPFANLAELRLEKNPITDAGVGALLPLTSLISLNLVNTKVTDAGLTQLAGVPNLRRLYLWGAAVRTTAVDRFKTAHPGILVYAGIQPSDVNMNEPVLKPVN